MKPLVVLIIALTVSVAGYSCPFSPSSYERFGRQISESEQDEREQGAYTFEGVASVNFGTTKQEVLSLFEEPIQKIPSVRSHEGEFGRILRTSPAMLSSLLLTMPRR